VLPIQEFARWIRQRGYAEAAASVLNAIGDYGSRDPVDLAKMSQTEDQNQVDRDRLELTVAEQYRRHPSRFPTPENLLSAKRLSVTLEAALSPQQAKALQLLTEGYSYREIAEILRVCESTARVHVYQARQKARKLAM
jgi:RNA polymerase sigma factor (sigma-70 family)